MDSVSRMRMVIVAIVLATIGILGSYPGNTFTALAASDVGYRDFSFAASGVSNPTGEKPQSKLWFNDGVWWGSLFNRATAEFHIYRYDWPAHSWNDTGTLIDERNSSTADTLWDGTHLYVVSAGTDKTDTLPMVRDFCATAMTRRPRDTPLIKASRSQSPASDSKPSC
jgi:hypothetical protein